MMTTTNQGMSFAEFEQIIAQRVANAIETIAIYEIKTRVARESMNQIKQQEEKIAEDTSNKRKWEGDHKGSLVNNKTKSLRTLVLRAKQSPSVAKQKAEVTCYECGMLGHYKSKCPKWKFQKRVNEY
ncbi:putative reverse transcriptase domain-containing protein [Tanacetum coccineum]|uniref:Reverse transcriptase domain-containing protein n=1 Tax=Tanacetum coccineum TaxID=301880 RepID=A0ABQ5EP54_9ASTR